MSELLDMELTITSDFYWKPGFQLRIRNLEMTTSPPQRSTSLWHAHKSRSTFSRNFTRIFSSERARRAVIWITRTSVISQLMKAFKPSSVLSHLKRWLKTVSSTFQDLDFDVSL